MLTHRDKTKMEKLSVEFGKRKTFWEILKSEMYFKWIIVTPLLVVLVAFAFYPLFYCLYLSFYRSLTHLDFVGLNNYRIVLHNRMFWEAIGHTVYILIVCVCVEVIIGMGISFFLNQEFKGQNIIRTLCLTPIVVSPLAMSLIWGYILNPQTGIVSIILNKWLGFNIEFFKSETALYTIMGIEIWRWLPFSIFVFLAALKGFPKEPFEAASVDGASKWFTFTKITLPMLKPYIVIVVLLRTMWLIRLYDPLFGTTHGGSGTEVLDWYINRTSFTTFNVTMGATQSIIALYMAMPIGMILFQQLMKAMTSK